MDILDEDLYSRLGVTPQASAAEIKMAYKKQALRLHPDKTQTPGAGFKLLQEAHEALTDPYKREIYNKFGRPGLEVTAIKKHKLTPNQVEHEMKKVAYGTKKAWFDTHVNFSSHSEMSLALWDIPKFWQGRGLYTQPQFVVNHGIMIPLSSEGAGKSDLTLSVGLRTALEGGYSGKVFGERMGFLGASWIHQWNEFTTTTARVNIGMEYADAHFGTERQLNRDVVASQGFHYNGRHGSGMSVGIGRNFTVPLPQFLSPNPFNFNGSMRVIVGQITNGLSLALKHLSENNNFESQFTVRTATISAEAEYKQLVSPKTFLKFDSSFEWPTFSWSVSSGIQKGFSKLNKLDLDVQFGSIGIQLILGFRRWGQKWRIPLIITTVMSIETLIATVITGVVSSILTQLFLFEPLEEMKVKAKMERRRETLVQERERAQEWLKAMQHSIEQAREEESKKDGLLIIHAVYGNLSKRPNFHQMRKQGVSVDIDDINEEEEDDPEIINVTSPLQFLVSNGELHLHGAAKHQLPGFYDPCTNYPNYLQVYYLFEGEMHQVILDDKDELHIPSLQHLQ